MKFENKTLADGRFPWFDIDGKPFEPYLLGIAGGSASGKTSVSMRILKSLNVPWVRTSIQYQDDA